MEQAKAEFSRGRVRKREGNELQKLPQLLPRTSWDVAQGPRYSLRAQGTRDDENQHGAKRSYSHHTIGWSVFAALQDDKFGMSGLAAGMSGVAAGMSGLVAGMSELTAGFCRLNAGF